MGENRTITLPAVGTMTIDEMEKQMIQKALEFHGNNVTSVARSVRHEHNGILCHSREFQLHLEFEHP